MASTLRPSADDLMRKKATQKLYLLLPNHECPQKNCPFHPPEDEVKEEEESITRTLSKLQEIGAAVPEGGGVMMPPPPPFPKAEVEEEGVSKDSLSELTMDTGEESVASDYESIMTLDSGVGRERDELSDTGDTFTLPLPSDLLRVDPELHFIEEDDEVKTLTSEPVTLEDVTEHDDADDERVTPVLFCHIE